MLLLLQSPVVRQPSSEVVSSGGGGGRSVDWYSERRDKPEEPNDELAILLAAYMQYFKD